MSLWRGVLCYFFGVVVNTIELQFIDNDTNIINIIVHIYYNELKLIKFKEYSDMIQSNHDILYLLFIYKHR